MKLPFWPDPKGYRDINFGLSRVYDLLARLGNPHLKIPPAIHIAGTNGKGSTLAFLRAIFAESGLKIHTYTSPHLVNFNERIVLAGKEISDEILNEILRECQEAAEKSPAIPLTFFEGITVAAFLAFSRLPADLLLLEVGMGGRLDATNVLPEVLCSVITPISFDHTEFLGKTLSKIAFEKAGIIKKNCPLVIGKQKPSILRVLENRAAELGCEVKILGRDFFADESLPKPSLIGAHQIENAATAITTATLQRKFLITEEQIKSALKKVTWPARLQKINSGKFFNILPKNCELYLDGSHNPQGATTILDFLKTQKGKKNSVIFSMLKDKDCASFLKKISSRVGQLIALEIPDEPKSRDGEELQKIGQELGINSLAAENFDQAFEKIFSSLKPDEPALILICGSLYLAGSFLTLNH
jgi:dihydrofolate synthase/folylpolyglutamate synthase